MAWMRQADNAANWIAAGVKAHGIGNSDELIRATPLRRQLLLHLSDEEVLFMLSTPGTLGMNATAMGRSHSLGSSLEYLLEGVFTPPSSLSSRLKLLRPPNFGVGAPACARACACAFLFSSRWRRCSM